MATDFKLPKKFLLDHYVESIFSEDGTVATGVNFDIPDELRSFLGLIYSQNFSAAVVPFEVEKAIYFYNLYRDKLFLSKSAKGTHRINQSSTAPTITDVEHKSLLEFFRQLQEDLSFDATTAPPIFQDFNFKPENEKTISLKVDTITRALNTFDIKQGDQFFTNGDLNPDKEETSLKFAYAFKTIKLMGETEIISKQTQLIPNAIDIQNLATNENNNPTKINQLKNLIYFGDGTKAIEEEVIGEDSQSSIDIDTIYNLLTIDIPEQASSNLQNNSVWTYLSDNKTPLLNGIDQPSLDADKLDEFIKLYYQELAIQYFSRLLDSKEENELKLIGSVQYPPFQDLTYFGILTPFSFFATSEELQKELLGEFIVTQKRNDDFFKGLQRSATNKFSEKSTLISDDIISNLKDILAPNVDNISVRKYVNALSAPAFYETLQIILDSKLRNYSLSEVFKGAFKNPDNKFRYDYGEQQQNLLRDGKLVGLRVVKSLQPLDPANGNNPNSILQTYHIPVQLTEDNQQIRLFDSQITYGQDYYYTLYGIYSVDGKFYYYDNTDLQIVPAVLEEKIIEEKAVINNVQKVAKGSFEFINPCCRYSNENLNKNLNNAALFVRQHGVGLGAESEFEAAKEFWDIDVSKPETDAKIQNKLQLQPYDVVFDLNKKPISAENAFFTGRGLLTQILTRLYREEQTPSIINYFTAYKQSAQQAADALSVSLEQAKVYNENRKQLVCFLCSRRGSAPQNKIPTPARLIELRMKQNNDLLEDFYNGKLLGGVIDCRDFGYKNANGFGGFEPEFPQFTVSNDLLGEDRPKVRNIDPKTQQAGAYKYKCKRFDTISKKKQVKEIEPEKFKEFSFEIKEANATRLFDIPLQSSFKSSVVDVVPLPPVVTFVPLADVNNKIKIKFQEAMQSDYLSIKPDYALESLNGPFVLDKLKEQYGNLLVSGDVQGFFSFTSPFVAARSQADVAEIHAFKLDRKPDSLEDLIDNGEQFTLDFLNGKTTYFSNVKPNQKYYYAFVSRDIAGLYSTATETYELEIVEDSGFVYTTINPYYYIEEQEKQTSQKFQKLLKVKPSFEELLPNNAQNVGTKDLYSTISNDKSAATEAKAPLFKIRVKSKKTKRVFDINLKFTQDVREITSGRLLKQIKKVSSLIDEVETSGWW